MVIRMKFLILIILMKDPLSELPDVPKEELPGFHSKLKSLKEKIGLW